MIKFTKNILVFFVIINFFLYYNIPFLYPKEYILFDYYVYHSNYNIYISRMKYIPCSSCGLGNKLLGLISSISYGITYSFSLKIINWDSLWWYFSFPIKLDRKNLNCNITFKGHFYAIKDIIQNISTRKYLISIGIIKENSNLNIMINEFAFKISSYFLKISDNIKIKINTKYFPAMYYGTHIRTGKADGKEYLLHYLKYEDILNILLYINKIKRNESVYISSDSSDVKYMYYNELSDIFFINSSTCNSGFGLLKENNKCAIEAIVDYYILSKCKYLILTKCSSYSLVSLFANEIGYKNIKMHKYFGNCSIHTDLYN